jgi:hypothetical protein
MNCPYPPMDKSGRDSLDVLSEALRGNKKASVVRSRKNVGRLGLATWDIEVTLETKS